MRKKKIPSQAESESLFVRPPQVGRMRDPLNEDWNRAFATPPIIDFGSMNAIFANFLDLVGLPIAIIDLDGHVLASSRWQRICVEFHRVNPGTLSRCLESDVTLSQAMADGKSYAIYRCRNGLTDCATPIVVEDIHVANLFVGQFLLAPPDPEEFRCQQEEFGFDPQAYAEALSEVPIVSEDRLPAILRLMGGFAEQIGRQSLAEQRVRAAYEEVERQVAERTRELAESHQRLHKIADHVPGVVFQFMRRADGGYCVPYVSDAFTALFGATPEQVRDDAAPVFDAVHPDDHDAFRGSVEESAASLAPWRHEFRLLRPDGTVRWVGGEALPQREADGATLWHGFISDITHRKRTEEILRRRYESLRALNDIAALPAHGIGHRLSQALALGARHLDLPFGIVACVEGDRYTVLDCNAPRESGIAAGQEFPLGHTFCAFTMVAGDVVAIPHVAQSDHAAHPCHRFFGLEAYIAVPVHVDGRVFGTVSFSSPAPYARDFDEGDFEFMRLLGRWVGSFIERQQAEVEVVAAKETAEARARDLAQSNADLEQFAYVASHDLRQPLRMVSSYLGLIERRFAPLLDDDGREFIGYARGGALQMDRLIRDLLEYSRVGRDTSPEPVDLAGLAAEAGGYLGPLAEEAGATVEIATDPAPTVGNRSELVRLFQNLVGNAIKYRDPARPPRITVGWRLEDGEWLVSISDNGIGIAPEFSHDIFKIFRRLHSSGEYEGTGIGLAVCQKIVTHHHGRIWVESRPGAGSTFKFTLPAAAS